MRLSDAGLEAIKAREGVVLNMYRDSAHLPTIGVGHLLTRDELYSGKLLDDDWRDGISAETADELLRHDAETAQAAVGTSVHVPLTQYQYDTLVSLAFNIGGTAFRKSTLVRLLNTGDYLAVPGQLRRWVFSAGVRDPILVKRREGEVHQWENDAQ
jgi:lysozyme